MNLVSRDLSYTNIVAHNHILEDIVNLYNINKLNYAYMLTGIKGIGKATCAFKLAQILLSHDKSQGLINLQSLNLNQSILKLIQSNTYDNLLVIRPTKDNLKTNSLININQIRLIKNFLSFSSTQSQSMKVIIIDSIDNFNINSANAILKLLEEPRTNCVFFIINHNSNNNLPKTLQSRCIVKYLTPLTNQHMTKILNQQPELQKLLTSNELKEVAISNSEGSLNHLLWFTNEKNYQAYTIAKQIIMNNERSLITKLLKIIQELSFDSKKFLSDLIMYKIYQPKELSLSENHLKSTSYIYSKLIDKSKLFNLDLNSILISLILSILKK